MEEGCNPCRKEPRRELHSRLAELGVRGAEEGYKQKNGGTLPVESSGAVGWKRAVAKSSGGAGGRGQL